MPMQKIYSEKNVTIKNEEAVKGPKKKSIDFIKQFARIYSCQSMLQPELGGFMAN